MVSPILQWLGYRLLSASIRYEQPVALKTMKIPRSQDQECNGGPQRWWHQAAITMVSRGSRDQECNGEPQRWWHQAAITMVSRGSPDQEGYEEIQRRCWGLCLQEAVTWTYGWQKSVAGDDHVSDADGGSVVQCRMWSHGRTWGRLMLMNGLAFLICGTAFSLPNPSAVSPRRQRPPGAQQGDKNCRVWFVTRCQRGGWQRNSVMSSSCHWSVC